MIRTSAHADICAHSKWAPYHSYPVAQDNTFQICWGLKSKVCEWAESHRGIQSVVGWIGGRSMPCTRAWTPWYGPFSIGFSKFNTFTMWLHCTCDFHFLSNPFLDFLRSYTRACWTPVDMIHFILVSPLVILEQSDCIVIVIFIFFQLFPRGCLGS